MSGRASLLAVLLLALLAVPSGANAATPSLKKAIWGPVAADGVSQFPVYADLGVGVYQYALAWPAVAPSRPTEPRNPGDPAYRWPAELDAAILQARQRGVRVSVMLTEARPDQRPRRQRPPERRRGQ